MPRVSIWFVRAALGYLAFGFTLGALLMWHKVTPLAAMSWSLRPAHVEFLLIGWTAQLALGVALWIFPRRRLASQPYGPLPLAWLAFALLNSGVWLVAISPFLAPETGAALEWSGRLVEIGAVVACAGNLWGRVRPGLSQM
jgi:hypothetical protein